MTHDPGRPTRLAGWWSFLVGGALLAVLLVILDPVVVREDCSNYSAAGNASAFTDESWDLYLPGLVVVWLLAIAIEQVLEVTGRHRDRTTHVLGGLAAFLAATVLSCCVVGQLALMCH